MQLMANKDFLRTSLQEKHQIYDRGSHGFHQLRPLTFLIQTI